jgi:hypothetical protein
VSTGDPLLHKRFPNGFPVRSSYLCCYNCYCKGYYRSTANDRLSQWLGPRWAALFLPNELDLFEQEDMLTHALPYS